MGALRKGCASGTGVEGAPRRAAVLEGGSCPGTDGLSVSTTCELDTALGHSFQQSNSRNFGKKQLAQTFSSGSGAPREGISSFEASSTLEPSYKRGM